MRAFFGAARNRDAVLAAERCPLLLRLHRLAVALGQSGALTAVEAVVHVLEPGYLLVCRGGVEGDRVLHAILQNVEAIR
eukprot:4842813-Pyramimonas_sp.AAC.1